MYSKQLIDQSSSSLHPRYNKVQVLPKMQKNMSLYTKQNKNGENLGLSQIYHDDYKPASYKKALLFKNQHSYQKKIGINKYVKTPIIQKQIELFQDTKSLKSFGLGPYFFIEFQRRIVWLFLLFSILEAVRIGINSKSSGLSTYQGSFGSYLVGTTIGNFNGNVIPPADVYVLTLIPFLIYVIFFFFYMWWKCHYLNAIRDEEQLKEFVKPQKFCVQIQGFESGEVVKQIDLQELYSVFGPVYQISLVREYDGNLKYFQQLDQLEQRIKQEQLELILGSGDKNKLKQLKKQKEQLYKYVHTLRIKPSIRSAFVHFQFQKSKVDMLEYYSNHYLFGNKISHSFMRTLCCCCIDEPEPRYLFEGKKLYIKEDKLTQPEDINWDSYEIGICGKIFRILFSAFIILVFLAISCSIISLCSIYISTHSIDCQGFVIPPTLDQAKATTLTDDQKKCFCNANFISSINNQPILAYCGVLINQIYAQQAIQYAITTTSTLVNIIFGVVVHKLVNLSQPKSHSVGYLWKTTVSSIFLIFNTVFLPLLIYANIFGFKTSYYVSLITIVSTDVRAFLQVENIKFYLDFEKIWYRNVSPIFVNYVILDIVLTWAFFIFYKFCCSKNALQSQEGTILQKSMNQKITSWKLNASDQFANFNLIIFLCMFYNCGIPVIVPLAFINLFSKYISNRSLLQGTSSRIEGLSLAFNSFPISSMPIILILGCIVGCWQLTANQQINSFTQMKIFLSTNEDVLNRELILPFFLILSIIILFQFLFYNTIIRFCRWISKSCFDRKQVVHPYYTRQYSNYIKQMSVMASYNIRNNIKYKNAIITLEKYLQDQEKV